MGEQEIKLELENATIGGGGAVNSVNGKTGNVILTTSDVENTSDYQNGEEVQASIQAAISELPAMPTKTSDLTNDGADGTSTYVEADELAPVSYSGKYTDLTDTPTIPAAQIQSDWGQSDNSKVDYIKNKPTIPAVNDATLTITQGGITKGTFTANDADDTTIDLDAGRTYTAGDGINISAQDVISATNTGKARVLTTDDYNWPTTGTKTSVALWLLPSGIYIKPDGVAARVVGNKTATNNGPYIVRQTTSELRGVVVDLSHNSTTSYYNIYENGTSYQSFNTFTPVVDGLTSTSTTSALSANQGKVLKDLVDSLVIKNAGVPTTATVGSVGQLLEDTTNGDLYICTDATNPYVWEEVGAGGSGVTELTSADYNWPTNNPDGVAAWNLTDEYYKSASTVKIYASSTRALSTSASKKLLISSTSSAKTIYSFGGNGNLEATVTVIDNGSETFHYTYKNPDIVQTTGSSTTDVMSQNAVTSMVFADPSTSRKIKIGSGASSSLGADAIEIGYNTSIPSASDGAIAIGPTAHGGGRSSIALGRGAATSARGAIALGAYSSASTQGEMNIGTSSTDNGYNNSNYRLLTGLYDPQSAHDAATKGYVDTAILNGGTTAPTTATVGAVGTLYTYVDTTGTPTAHLCVCTEIDTTDPNNPVYTWQTLV